MEPPARNMQHIGGGRAAHITIRSHWITSAEHACPQMLLSARTCLIVCPHETANEPASRTQRMMVRMCFISRQVCHMVSCHVVVICQVGLDRHVCQVGQMLVCCDRHVCQVGQLLVCRELCWVLRVSEETRPGSQPEAGGVFAGDRKAWVHACACKLSI